MGLRKVGCEDMRWLELGKVVCAMADGGVSGDEPWFQLPER